MAKEYAVCIQSFNEDGCLIETTEIRHAWTKEEALKAMRGEIEWYMDAEDQKYTILRDKDGCFNYVRDDDSMMMFFIRDVI